MTDFVHLHNHSEYSLLDGANRVQDLVDLAARHEMPAIALTDHGVMHGAVEFAKTCQKKGIQPLVGCEVYTAAHDRPRSGRDKRKDRENYHLLLLAQNETGYRNLCRLSSLAFTEGFYYKPRIDLEILSQHSEGLIGTSACLGSEICKALQDADMDRARAVVAHYRDILGPDRFFLELQDHGQPEDKLVNPQLAALAKEFGLGLVATNDIHYGRREDAGAHDTLLCIGTRAKKTDAKRLRYPSEEFYFKSEAEMRALFSDYPEALANTAEVARMVDFRLSTGGMILPHYDVPEGHTYDSYFTERCWEGAKRRYPKPTKAQTERIEYEMSVIRDKGYAAYFLIVADFVAWAHARDIPARCRGSAAGSVVSYLLGITNIDPLKYGLLFERFLYRERITPPDIDLDFADTRRQDVIAYCREKYGPDHVAQIITFGTLGAKAAIRDVARAMALPVSDADRLAKLIPVHQGRALSVEKALSDVPELTRLYEQNFEAREILDTARTVEGLSRHASVHAAAVVITPGPVTDFCPVQTSDTGLVTQYDMGAISDIGLLKMDFLGLRTLTVVEHCIRLMRARHPETIGEGFDIDAVPMNDKKTFRLLQEGRCAGVFQLESSGMRQLVRAIQPKRFEDLIPLVALYRPGPMDNGDMDRFIRRRHGEEAVSYPHPALEPILKDTYGLFVYQDQILKVAMKVAGFGAKDADDLLRSMSKKKLETMQGLKQPFLAGMETTSQVPAGVAEGVWDAMESFAAYGFNMNHAGAYAILSYQTAWLKANYPLEFMAALLTSVSDNADKVALYVDDCRQSGMPVLLPCVNQSDDGFGIAADGTSEAIRFGLKAIHGVGEGPAAAVLAARDAGGPFSSMADFCRRVDLGACHRATIETMVKAGAFDRLYPDRNQGLAALEATFAVAQRSYKDRKIGQTTLFDDEEAKVEETLPDTPPMPARERMALEKELLGLYLSSHPLDELQERIRALGATPMDELALLKNDETVLVVGLLAEVRKHLTKAEKKAMGFLKVEDARGRVSVTVFPRVWQACAAALVPDAPLAIRGRLVVKDAPLESDGDAESEVEILADEVLSLEAAAPMEPSEAPERRYRRVCLDISQATPDDMHHLKGVLKDCLGDGELLVRRDGQSLTSQLRVSPTWETVRAAARILGSDFVWLD